MKTQVVQVPLFEQVAAELREGGTFQRDLTGQDVAEIMRGVIGSLVSGPATKEKQEVVKVEGVEKMIVDISGQRGTVSGEVRVVKPVGVRIPVKCVLVNSDEPQRLRLDRLSIGSGLTKIALKTLGRVLGVDVEAEARKQLSDPNRALTTALAAQLESRGVKLTGAGLQFKGTVLSVSLRGEPIQRR